MVDQEPKDALPGSITQMQPRLPIFSGEDKDSPYDLWQFEVECLIADKRPECDIRAAIRRSLKGQACRTMMTLGTDATVKQILSKFQKVFGPTELSATVLTD